MVGVSGSAGPLGVALLASPSEDQLLLHVAIAINQRMEAGASMSTAEAAKERGNAAFKEGKLISEPVGEQPGGGLGCALLGTSSMPKA